MTKPLTKFTDVRGTICIAQVGIEIPYAIGNIHYGKSSLDDISLYDTFTMIVVKGTSTIKSKKSNVTLEADTCHTFYADDEIESVEMSTSCLYIIISHEKLAEDNQLEKSFSKNTSVQDCKVHHNNPQEVDYDYCMKNVQRIFYLKDIKEGKNRGGHAHKYCQQGLIALEGKFSVLLEDGTEEKKIVLNDPKDMLYVAPYIFASESEFSKDAVCLVIASHRYDRTSYIDYLSELKEIKREI